jgi:tetrapyrrole methylase family protein/MazG family protein
MTVLRSPEGCAWDREQTHDSIKKNLIEEAYEAVETIENNDINSLKEELGDVILQVVFHSQIAEEKKEFDINAVLKEIINKLHRRHPHVFGNKSNKDPEEVLADWEEIKKNERKKNPRKTESIFNDIPKMMPALHYAFEVQNRAARLGFDWEDKKDVLKKVKEELAELNNALKKQNYTDLKQKKVAGDGAKDEIMQELGDLFFSLVNLARRLDVDSEEALRCASRKFIRRFDAMEKLAKDRSLKFKDLSLIRKDELWETVKSNE